MSDITLEASQEVGTVRKLWPSETDKFRDHLLRLDRGSRRMRFAHAVSDTFIADYATRMLEFGSICYGYIVDGEIRAVAELRKLSETWGEEAEAAFSVEAAYQDRGIGSELMGRVIRAARNRGVRLLYMSCLAENERMQAIAKKYEADLRFELGDVVGEIVPEEANYFSIMAEAAEDRVSYLMAVFDLQSRVINRLTQRIAG
ncbi:MAG TPA: GNAT family N-acetyltransferase [Hyphomicrobiaceae bacterium]|nr:GNAT family N-acetyltransferase [Hyphomicrobiaceae bacterium]